MADAPGGSDPRPGDESETLRVAVVDDEPLVREDIVRHLGRRGDVELVGEAGDGAEAIRVLSEKRPDLVFLDIQMPECDGFEVLQALPEGPPPAVVFVTAYDAYAIRAFDVHAVDYLLKPFDEERLDVALERARGRIAPRSPGGGTTGAIGHDEGIEDLRPLMRELAAGGRTSRRLAVRSRGRIEFLDVDRIDWVEAAGNYARLHVGESTHLYRSTLTELAERFPGRLLRIHRSYLVAPDRVRELRPLSGGDALVVLRDGEELRLSRTHREEFEARMTGEAD